MRTSALYIYVIVIGVYAWKDWFKSLCGLILLMAVMEHEDMPRTMFNIQGFNMWNLLFFGIFLAWMASRRREGLKWDMPCYVNVLLLMYLGVILLGFLRAVFDRGNIQDYALRSLISDRLINTIKWVLPGILLFDGCRTRRRAIMVLVCLCVVYFLISAQVVRRLPWSSVLRPGDDINRTRRACQRIGYGACDMSAMLAGASWAIIATSLLVRKKMHKMLVFSSAGIVAFGQALTGGRAGYLAWGATGMALCLLKWRKYLVLAPVIVMLLPIVFPGAVGRMFEGFGQTDVAGQSTLDDYSVTSDRTAVWPHVIDKIAGSPVFGYGRLAMIRTGLTGQMTSRGYTGFDHPHNMYLETLLDNGIVGSAPILLFWGITVLHACRLFRSKNRVCSAVGGVAASLVLAQLFSGIGSQHVYPEESTLGAWAAMFLLLRVHIELARVQEGVINVVGVPVSQSLPQPAISAVGA